MCLWAAASLQLGLAHPGAAQELSLPPGVQPTQDTATANDAYDLPTGPWAEGLIPTRRIEGKVIRQAWTIPARQITTLQLIAPLRTQLETQGFQILLDCDSASCGGFDFRFGTQVLPPPAMFVDLTEYRFLSAGRQQDDGSFSGVSVWASRSDDTAYLQIIRAGQAPITSEQIRPDGPRLTSEADLSLTAALESTGRYVLDDLEFQTGSAELGGGDFISLAALAAYLQANATRRIALVGHTDSVGALDGNIALSKRRARSVRDRLVAAYGADPGRVAAEGMGYLSPVASNLTPEGREANRRVEAVLISVE